MFGHCSQGCTAWDFGVSVQWEILVGPIAGIMDNIGKKNWERTTKKRLDKWGWVGFFILIYLGLIKFLMW